MNFVIYCAGALAFSAMLGLATPPFKFDGTLEKVVIELGDRT